MRVGELVSDVGRTGAGGETRPCDEDKEPGRNWLMSTAELNSERWEEFRGEVEGIMGAFGSPARGGTLGSVLKARPDGEPEVIPAALAVGTVKNRNCFQWSVVSVQSGRRNVLGALRCRLLVFSGEIGCGGAGAEEMKMQRKQPRKIRRPILCKPKTKGVGRQIMSELTGCPPAPASQP